MALADSMLKYGMKKIKMSQASNLGNTISKIGDLGMEAGAALTKVAKATESNRKSYETIQAGKKEVGIDDEGSFLEKTGLKSSLGSDKSFDVNYDEGGINPRKVSYDARGLKQIGTLSSTYSSDYLIEKYGQDWKEKYGVKSNIKTPFERNKSYWNELNFEDSSENPDAEWQNKSEASGFKAEAPNEETVDPYSIVPSGPSAPINPDTGHRFMTVKEGKAKEAWDIKNKKQMQKVRDDAIKTESDRQYNKDKKNRSQSEIDKEEFLNALKSSSDDSVKDEFFAKHETIETYSDTPSDKEESNISNTTSPLPSTGENQIEDSIINNFTKQDSSIIKESPEDISLKYQNMAKEEGLNFAASDIDKKTGKTIYNLYNREGKNLGAIFSMKDNKMTKVDKEFFKNLKHFKELSFPSEAYPSG
jgi:hypothetical protein